MKRYFRRDSIPTLDYNPLGCNSLVAMVYNLFMFYILTAFPPSPPRPTSSIHSSVYLQRRAGLR